MKMKLKLSDFNDQRTILASDNNSKLWLVVNNGHATFQIFHKGVRAHVSNDLKRTISYWNNMEG